MVYDGPERRYTHRHHVSGVSAQYRHTRFGLFRSGLCEACEITDINWRGMRVYTKPKLRPGQMIEVHLQYLDEMELSTVGPPLLGKVAWREWSSRRGRWRTGVHFLNVSEATREALLSLVNAAVARAKLYGASLDMT